MQLHFDRVERTFSAAEVAEFFGVPEVTQRDWRRRERKGELTTEFFRSSEKGKKFQFTLAEACALAMAKVQTDSGKAISGALVTAKLSAEVAIRQIELCQVGVAFEGIDLDAAQRREIIRDLNEFDEDEGATRYVFFPAKSEIFATLDGSVAEGPTCYHFGSLAEMEEQVVNNWVYGSIFDLGQFALSLAFKFKEPLVTYRLTEVDE